MDYGPFGVHRALWDVDRAGAGGRVQRAGNRGRGLLGRVDVRNEDSVRADVQGLGTQVPEVMRAI